MKQVIKLGVCGLGRFGVEHCRFFSRDREQYQITALCDIDPARVDAAKTQFGGRGYTEYEAFLRDRDVELVIIATPSLEHARNAARALAAGKIVLLEKPIGVTAADFELLKYLVENHSRKIYFGHNHRFEPAFNNTRAIINTGILGKIHVVKLCKHHAFMRRNDWQMRLDCGGGQLSVWGPHLLDQGLQLLNAPVREVRSYLKRILTPGDADDHVQITLVGANETVVEIEISNSVALAGPYCTIYGDRGTLIYGQDQKQIHLKYLDPQFCWTQAQTNSKSPPKGQAMSAEQELPWIEETRQVEPQTSLWDHVEIELATHLFNAIRNGISFPVTSSQALEVVRITQIIKQQNPQFQWIG